MKNLLVVGLIALGAVAFAKPAAQPPRAAVQQSPKFPIKFGAPPSGGPRLGATTAGASPSVQRYAATTDAGGNAVIVLQYTNASGSSIHTRTIHVPACATAGPLTDQFGTVVAATQPVGLCNAIATFNTQLDTLISNAATAGKLNM